MVSNPWKPKKQVAAPATTPVNPNGKNPPAPALSRILGSISSGLICQLWKSTWKHDKQIVQNWHLFTLKEYNEKYISPLKQPHVMTYNTIVKLHNVKMLLKRVDSLTPKVKTARNVIKRVIENLKVKRKFIEDRHLSTLRLDRRRKDREKLPNSLRSCSNARGNKSASDCPAIGRRSHYIHELHYSYLKEIKRNQIIIMRKNR